MRRADFRECLDRRGLEESGGSGAWLRGLQQDGCRYFGMILGPDDNTRHGRHFHMQFDGMRSDGLGFCR